VQARWLKTSRRKLEASSQNDIVASTFSGI
jgi:hypothetical protein